MENTLATSSGSVSPETKDKHTTPEGKCPVAHGARKPHTNADWWPNQVNVNILHQHSPKSPIRWARSSITRRSSRRSI